MACSFARLHLVELILCGLAVACSGELASAADGQQGPTSFTEIKRAVLLHFDKTPNYRPGDIISRGDVKPLFGKLERLGWTPEDRKEILAAVPADNDFLVKQLRTPAGRKLMRNVAKYPDAFDRLDRISKLPYGKNTVKALVRGPDGYKMIEYMTTTKGGRQMGKMLSDTPKGTGFNKPTGRIYTVKQLLARLKQSYGPCAPFIEKSSHTCRVAVFPESLKVFPHRMAAHRLQVVLEQFRQLDRLLLR